MLAIHNNYQSKGMVKIFKTYNFKTKKTANYITCETEKRKI